jgi:signal peptidase II
MRKVRVIGILAIIGAFAADQMSKALIVANAEALWPPVPVMPGLNLAFGRNTGVTFGLMAGMPWWVLTGLSVAMAAGLAVWLWRSGDLLLSMALGLVIGGAMGNALDRLRYGGVTDFIDVYVASYHWPTFNLADVAIVTGAFALVFEGYLRPSSRSSEPTNGGGS